jgi:tryptophan synthase alpha chain
VGGRDLEDVLRARLARDGRCFVPYVTGGLPGVDPDLLRGLADAGADAVEVGIPFSDPVMDGPVIQDASRRALEAGATPGGVLDTVAAARLDRPVVVMTYLNPVLSMGIEAFLDRAGEAGVSGLVVPDLPVDEAHELLGACGRAAMSLVLLVAPGLPPERMRAIGERSGGFVYCVSTYGVTGERGSLGPTAEGVVAAMRRASALPLLVGVGIGDPERAAEVCRFADGVVVGTALVRPLLRGDREGTLALARRFREAIPAGSA